MMCAVIHFPVELIDQGPATSLLKGQAVTKPL